MLRMARKRSLNSKLARVEKGPIEKISLPISPVAPGFTDIHDGLDARTAKHPRMIRVICKSKRGFKGLVPYC